jgi:hypothetical protein
MAYHLAGEQWLFINPGWNGLSLHRCHLVWADTLALGQIRLVRWIVGFGLSYAFVTIFGLFLHYLYGPISFWMVLVVLDGLVLSASRLSHRNHSA